MMNVDEFEGAKLGEEFEPQKCNTRIENASVYIKHQRDNQMDTALKSIWLKSSSENMIQNDGRKVNEERKNACEDRMQKNYKEMQDEDTRWKTFKVFPKPTLSNKIYQSGYFYTGRSDATVCHRCEVEIDDWKEKDIPATFHEPDCLYHVSPPKEAMETQYHLNDVSMNSSNSLEAKFAYKSLLDIPITDSNTPSVPMPLIPVPAEIPSRPQAEAKHKSIESLHANVNLEEVKKLSPLSRSLSLDLENVKTRSTPVTSTHSPKKVPNTKKVFVFKHQRPLIKIANVNTKNHEELLLHLNLFAEDDRRKTFMINDMWQQNTNNVVSPNELARDGFFYLGNQQRTQCFSCEKVVRVWMRGDIVNEVHRTAVPYCRMAKGEETQNLPIPIWQPRSTSSPSSYSSFDPIPTLPVDVYPQREYSFQPVKNPEPIVPSHQAQLVQMSVNNHPYYTKSEIQEVQHSGNHPRYPEYHTGHRSEVTNPTSINIPLDLTVKRNSHFSEESHPQFEEHHSSVPLVERSSSLEANLISLPSGPEMMSLYPLPEEALHGVQPQSEEESEPQQSTLIPSSQSISNLSRSTYIPSISQSWHMGQTKLYNTPSLLPTTSNTEQTISSPIASNIPLLTTDENEWAAIFPCENPAFPRLRSAISRQETFTHLWPNYGFNTSIEEFAKAGFFFSGFNDHLKCWYCDGGIQEWNADDDPWEEHARLYPTCEYLLQQKGPEYVHNVSKRVTSVPQRTSELSPRNSEIFQRTVELPQSAEIFPGNIEIPQLNPQTEPRQVERSSSSSSSESSHYVTPVPGSPIFGNSLEESPTPGSPMLLPQRSGSPNVTIFGLNGRRMFGLPFSSPQNPRVVDPREEEAKRKRELEKAMNSEAILAALEMGFDMRTIRKVVKRKIWNSDFAFPTPQALMEALLTPIETNSSSSSDSEGETAAGTSTRTNPQTSASRTSPISGANRLFPEAGGSASGAGDQTRSILEGAEQLDPHKLDKKLKEYEQQKRCKVCLDRDAEVVFVPCGHLCTCIQCANALRNCPLCRKRITKSMRIYTS